MAKILVADIDLKHIREIKEILESRDAHEVDFYCSEKTEEVLKLAAGSATNHLLFHGRSLDLAIESINIHKLDAVYISSGLISGTPLSWIGRFRAAITLNENREVPIVILSNDTSPEVVRQFMHAGIFDLIATPIDWPLFNQKFDLLLSKNVDQGSLQLYSQKISASIDLAHDYLIEEMSEFGVTIRSSKEFIPGEFVIFYCALFSEGVKAEAVGKCYAIKPHADKTAAFHASFMFIGLNQSILKNIRRSLRKEFAAKRLG